jgi:hypothetical protein
MIKFPTPQAVTKALHRDVPTVGGRRCHTVSDGVKFVCGPSITVQFEDQPFHPADVKRAKQLRENLIAKGWDVRPMREGSTIMYVNKIGAKK